MWYAHHPCHVLICVLFHISLYFTELSCVWMAVEEQTNRKLFTGKYFSPCLFSLNCIMLLLPSEISHHLLLAFPRAPLHI